MAAITDVSPTVFNMTPSWQSVTGRMLAFSSSQDGNVAFIGLYANLWVSKPDGTFRGARFVLADFGYEAGGWRVDKHPRLLADLRASGRADIVGFGDAGVYTALSRRARAASPMADEALPVISCWISASRVAAFFGLARRCQRKSQDYETHHPFHAGALEACPPNRFSDDT